ncbi:MAG: Ger(x)C family spore germination protein [Bacilli bacterium]|nr:Ger(x)C family spore germination protein [Bacilli bacterium]
MKKSVRFSSLMIGLLSLFVFAEGCEFKDIDKRFFVVGIGVDKPENSTKKYRITLKMAIPSGSIRMGSESFQNFTQNADSITEAVQLIKSRLDKEADFGHTKVLIFGQQLIKEDYVHPMDWFIRQRFIQKVAFMAIGKPSAHDVLEVQPKYERLPSNALFMTFGQVGVESQYIVTEDLYDVYRNNKDPGVTPIMPVIEAKQDHFQINTIGVLDRQKLVSVLSPNETRIINMLRARIRKGDFQVSIKGDTFMVHTDELSANKKAYFAATKPYVDINVNIQGVIEETQQNTRITETVLRQVQTALEKKVSHDVEDVLKKLQQQNLDPIGIGLTYSASTWDRKDVEEENWKKLYPKLDITAHTHVRINSPGEIQ